MAYVVPVLVLALCLALAAWTVAALGRQGRAGTRPLGPRVSDPSPVPGPAVGFGFKAAWLAVRTAEPTAVLDALGLRNAVRANWPHGVQAA